VRFIATETQIKKQRRVDNALCVGHFWTHCPADRFLVLGELVAWVYMSLPFVLTSAIPDQEPIVLLLGR
jgi:hypothetical protein